MSANEPMTQEQLDAIQEREAKATTGPWGVDGPAQCGPEDSLSVYPVKGGGALAYMQPLWDDAQFIAHAREDIPALLAEVDRLRALTTVTNEMIERGARAFYEYPTPGLDASLRTDWDRLTKASPDVADNYRAHTRATLDAALGTGEEA